MTWLDDGRGISQHHHGRPSNLARCRILHPWAMARELPRCCRSGGPEGISSLLRWVKKLSGSTVSLLPTITHPRLSQIIWYGRRAKTCQIYNFFFSLTCARRFSLKELRLVLATMLRRFELCLVEGQSHEMKVHSVPYFIQGGYHVGLRPRQ